MVILQQYGCGLEILNRVYRDGERYVLSLAHCNRSTYDDLLSVSSKSWFFKRKFIEEMRMNLQTVVLMAAGMAMVAFLIQDAEDYSRFIYIFTSGFSFVWMQITHRVYRKYWLSRRRIILMQEDDDHHNE